MVKAYVETEYDQMATVILDFLNKDGDMRFSAMTEMLLPCSLLNLAYKSLIGSTCGDNGGIRLLIGLSYVLALNVLFIALLYLALLLLAYSQYSAKSAVDNSDDTIKSEELIGVPEDAYDVTVK